MIKRKLIILLDFIIGLILPDNFYFSTKGYCPCCDKDVVFRARNSWLRDSFLCTNCTSIPRERAIMLIIERELNNWREMKIHESSPGNKGASLKLKENCKGYIASQYFPSEVFGTNVGEFRNEDLENQTFEEETFDLVVTQDVMEHVYDPAKAFKEIARTLKRDGFFIFTTPLVNKFRPSEIWAKKGESGKPIFMKEPEYHGNPVDPEGSPVTMHWGYDIVDFIKSTSGMDAVIEYIDDLNFGIRAEFNEVIVCRKS